MRTKISVLSFCFVLFLGTVATAQSSGGGTPTIGLTPSSILLKENRSSAVQKSNVVKIGIVSLIGLDPHIAFERVLTDKTSVNVTVAFIGFKDDIPFTDIEGEEVNTDVATKISIFTVTPEYRIYLSKRDIPRGFYVGPYLRYARYNMDFSTSVATTNDNGEPETVSVLVDGGMNTLGLGAQLGVQWVIADVVTIDWSFFGIGFNRYSINLTGTTDASNADLEQIAEDIQTNLEDVPFIGDRVKFDAASNSIEAKIPFYGMAIRTNLKVGYLF